MRYTKRPATFYNIYKYRKNIYHRFRIFAEGIDPLSIETKIYNEVPFPIVLHSNTPFFRIGFVAQIPFRNLRSRVRFSRNRFY